MTVGRFMPIEIGDIKSTLDLFGYKDLDTRIHITELVLFLDDVSFEPIARRVKEQIKQKKSIAQKDGDKDGSSSINYRRA